MIDENTADVCRYVGLFLRQLKAQVNRNKTLTSIIVKKFHLPHESPALSIKVANDEILGIIKLCLG